MEKWETLTTDQMSRDYGYLYEFYEKPYEQD